MADSLSTAVKPRRFQTRAFLIFTAVALAVAIPILPLRFLGIPGPDFPDVSQVVTTSKNWFSQMASRMQSGESTPPTVGGLPAPMDAAPAEKVKMMDTAAQQLSSDIEKNPSDPALQNRLGLVYLSLGDVDRACENFQKAISLSRLGISALSDKIASLRSAGNTKDASTALLEASKLNVELSAAHSNLARVYEKRGEHDKVIGELDMLNREGVLFDNTVAAHAPEANATTMLNPTVARDLARAEALLQARQVPQAADAYRRVLAQDPNVALAHHRLGTILAMSNNAAVAVDELEMAAKLDPGSPETQNDLGLAYQMMGLNLQAIKAYERALALEPRQTDSAINLANIYSSCGRIREAIAVLSQSIQNNPENGKAHNNLGTLFSLDGKYGPALYEFQKAVALSPSMPSAHYGLGCVLMQNKSYMPAISEFRQALALQPNLTQAQEKMNEAQRKAGMSLGSAQALN